MKTSSRGKNSSSVVTLRVFGLNSEALMKTRERAVSGDPSLKPALDALVKDADKAIRKGPYSVIHKEKAGPSGDKHDYVSLGTYWWPDPSKLDGLPYIRRDGERNPESSDRRFEDSSAMGAMADEAETLALAWYFTRNEKYAARAGLLLRTWFLDPATKMNPHLNYGQAVRGHNDGRGVGIIDSVSLIHVTDAVGLLAGSQGWSAKDQEGMVAWFKAYLEWMLKSPHGRDEAKASNNHGSWYDAQVASYALFVDDKETAKRILEESRERRIKPQIQPDGRQPEELARTKSLDYSLFNLRALIQLAELGERAGVDLWNYESKDGRSIRKALEYILPYAADPDKKWPNQQIKASSGLRTTYPALLRRAAIAFKDKRYEDLAKKILGGQLQNERMQLLYPAPEKMNGQGRMN